MRENLCFYFTSIQPLSSKSNAPEQAWRESWLGPSSHSSLLVLDQTCGQSCITRSQLLGKVRVISPKRDRGNLSIESFVKNQNQTIAAGFDQTI